MQLLGLSENGSSYRSLPASRFLEYASAYFCDKCDRDITGHFHIRRAHGSTPIGPPVFYCECGQRYLSGASEWDQLMPIEKRAALGFLKMAPLFALPFLGALTAFANQTR
jgi:hypothetical protein